MSHGDAADPALLVLRFPARAARLGEVRRAVQEAAQRGGCSAERARDVMLAVDEACQNVIRHAYGGECDEGIELEMRREGERLVLWLRDYAPSVDPERIRPRDLEEVRPGGLGVHLIRELMDEMRYRPDPSGAGNVLELVKAVG